ncbi:DUF2391 family protein [Candidatus Nanohalococcus occultus]|uniref:Membrane protein n=1 Tax=Candidatus Nanohalococcus occultus TaxID=2978047 RepID=A0ABY8CFB0_9ARCH|nr:putative membrane protein [Candidatus Nanohaloarchaeota archaeon SVXNc]
MIRELVQEASSKYPFGGDDFFQQIVGSALLSAPFIFTEEVWTIASNTSTQQSLASIAVTLLLGHGILYVAKQDRDFETERKVFGVTLRYISLMAVSFGSVLLVLTLTATAQTFGASTAEILKTVSIISVFSVIGAATADNLI